ncbi:MucBP domain-containing protein [Lentilactobacillus buchneri]|uniref:MucBP domain-containing protein n=1 Tax=Lentilactobacillus buchneri TaxID=1581 RepID=UPI0021A439A5|nr:MucBP domain-containing protein [Lentilactobacillus buchneri]
MLADPYKASGAGTYEIDSPEIAGYTADQPVVKGVLGKDDTINVYYTPKDVPPTPTNDSATVDVNYINEATGDLIQSKKIYGKIGGDYQADGPYQPDKLTVNGDSYTLDKDKLPANIKGQFSDQTPAVNYYYKKDATPVTPTNNSAVVTVNYINEENNDLIQSKKIYGKNGDSYQADGPYQPDKLTVNGDSYTLDKAKLPDNINGKFTENAPAVNYYYKKDATPVTPTDNSATVTVNYINEATGALIQSKKIYGKINDSYRADGSYQPQTLTVNGQTYTLDTDRLPNNITGTYSDKTPDVNYYYKQKQTPVTPVNPPINPVNPVTPVNPTPTPSPQPTPGTTTDNQSGKIAKKGEVVYSLKKIYLYKDKTFKKADRQFGYVKKPRVFRPMFVVTDYAKSNAGRLRYKVRDVNHLSKTDGWTGYITTNFDYVRPVYYHSSHQTLTVINPRGVNEYLNKNLTGKVKNIKQGTVLHVTGFVKHNLTTRYVLSNGHYITGNRKLVKMGKIKQPHQLKATHFINRYADPNLAKRNGHFKKGTKLVIKRYTFSHEASLTKSGTMRYAVKGGYVTANQKYVKVIK